MVATGPEGHVSDQGHVDHLPAAFVPDADVGLSVSLLPNPVAGGEQASIET